MTTPPPHAALLMAFAERVFRCHHCGAGGPEQRDTDQVPGPVRYRYLGEVLLLPFCPACRLDDDGRWRAGMELARAVDADTIAWVDRSPLSAYRCTRPRCERGWSHLGGPLPYPVLPGIVAHPEALRRHPCPWCVGEDPVATTADHEQVVRGVADLLLWEEELRGQS